MGGTRPRLTAWSFFFLFIHNKKANRFKSVKRNIMNVDVYVFGEVDSWWMSAEEVRYQLPLSQKGKISSITLHVDSVGGSVFEGFSMFSYISSFDVPVKTIIYGCAFSISSYVALSGLGRGGNEIYMSSVSSMLMIHNPSQMSYDFMDADEMRKGARQLDSIKDQLLNAYVLKTGRSREELSRLMDEETFFDAETAINIGLCDGIVEGTESEKNNVLAKKRIEYVNKLRQNYKNMENDLKNTQEPEIQAPETNNDDGLLNDFKELMAGVRETLESVLDKSGEQAQESQTLEEQNLALTEENAELVNKVATLEKEVSNRDEKLKEFSDRLQAIEAKFAEAKKTPRANPPKKVEDDAPEKRSLQSMSRQDYMTFQNNLRKHMQK